MELPLPSPSTNEIESCINSVKRNVLNTFGVEVRMTVVAAEQLQSLKATEAERRAVGNELAQAVDAFLDYNGVEKYREMRQRVEDAIEAWCLAEYGPEEEPR